ncbi:MAG: hypothetical protein L0Y44_14105, partial [Phycisphaerales bacterium]|nr:hypothetical protein [Phycisphaerales bacterium]MCI0631775.1 hypothetical protein [Phycisphaerales bacterium]
MQSLAVDTAKALVLSRDSNQALGIGQFAVDFVKGRLGKPSKAVLERTVLFHTDAVLCGLSALALRTNAPTLLRDEALEYPRESAGGRGKSQAGVPVLGSSKQVAPEKAIAANCSAVREW